MNPENNSPGQIIDQGRLRVSVVDPTTLTPISNATVRITRTATQEIIDELTTDTSGQTPVINLAAPPLDYSLDPMGGKPYAEYDVNVAASGFQTSSVDGVQLLPASTALQNVWLAEFGAVIPDPRTIFISPHTLWGNFPPKIPESEVKELPFPENLAVLPAPVIPEFIVVHLGVPTDATVQNVTVPFKDYIKNVTSAEIYSTWPAQTIRANTLAILSFTMNRVYTEWYRGKGYDFTITNSTAFDQAFSYGRNYYEDISVIVDEIFTSYITRPNARQPLLTQFCDGARTLCADRGMEQWGSKDLGEQGYDALTILRTYYGSDIYLATAQRVQGIPVSYPGFTLQLNSTGPEVRVIQEQLNRIAQNYPALPTVRVDGFYGPDTENAVRIFQQIINLPQTGVVNQATWYAISNIYVAVSGLAQPAAYRPRKR
jgi:peptidoglycan hydrolase-like protein with peptidoglycan-binding domain